MNNDQLALTRRSWDAATRSLNAYKGDQAAFFRAGGDTLFSEELELLGDVAGQDVLHAQCNSGQDSLSLARRGARVTGVDFSGEAISFARRLSGETGIPARFEEAELLQWLASTPFRFDLAFSSYGAVGWLPDLGLWARGLAREELDGDDYFAATPFHAPVGDYVAESGAALGAVTEAQVPVNTVPATSYQHGLGQVVQALLDAGLRLEVLREYPHANGCRLLPALVQGEGRRWVWPEGTARVPLMFGLRARQPSTG